MEALFIIYCWVTNLQKLHYLAQQQSVFSQCSVSCLGSSAGFNWSHSCGCTQLRVQLGLMVRGSYTFGVSLVTWGNDWDGWILPPCDCSFQGIFTAWWLQGSKRTWLGLAKPLEAEVLKPAQRHFHCILVVKACYLASSDAKARERDSTSWWAGGQSHTEACGMDHVCKLTSRGISKGLILFIVTLSWTIS